jgi:serine/threonine protein kinase
MLPERIGPYRVTRLISQGGMGIVYEAVQEPIARRVAVKVLRPEFVVNRSVVERFFNEARTVNLIEHPNIVQITDFGHAPDGTVYIAMEYLRGESLEQRLRRLGEQGARLGVQQALHIAQPVAEALAAAHQKGIVHRDLKPDNIMLVPESGAHDGERIKLLDFGIAKLLSSGPQGATLTQQLLGTPAYMSPEQCRGAGQVDERTDVYSLGVVLYRMLAGRPPFYAQGFGEILAMHLREEPPPLAGLAPQAPPELVALVHRLLAKDRNLRPQMREVLAEIELLLSELLVADSLVELEAPDAAAVPSASTLSRSAGQASARRPLRAGLGIGVGILVAVAAVLTCALLIVRTWKTTPVPPYAASAPKPQPQPPAPRPPMAEPVVTQLPAVRPEPALPPRTSGQANRKPAAKAKPRPAAPAASPPVSKKPPEVMYVD